MFKVTSVGEDTRLSLTAKAAAGIVIFIAAGVSATATAWAINTATNNRQDQALTVLTTEAAAAKEDSKKQMKAVEDWQRATEARMLMAENAIKESRQGLDRLVPIIERMDKSLTRLETLMEVLAKKDPR